MAPWLPLYVWWAEDSYTRGFRQCAYVGMRINAMHGPDMYAEMSTQRVRREVQSASKADVAKMRSVLFYAIKYLRFSKNNQTVYNMRVTPKT